MSKKSAIFYCGAARMLLVSPHLRAQNHYHNAIQITFSMDGVFKVWTEETGWFTTQNVLINSDVPHALEDFVGRQVTLGISPDAVRGINLQTKLLAEKKIMNLPHEHFDMWWPLFMDVVANSIPCSQAFDLCDRMIDKLTGKEELHGVMDSRIMDTIYHIHNSLHDDISAESLANRIHLSTDRFLHLFKEQLGLPLRQYILSQRIAVSTQAFVNGMPLKQAAYEGGFSDPAHFSRTFIQTYGAKPSDYQKLAHQFHFQFCLPSRA